MPKLHIAIDGNEANVKNRVGSNVYAYQLIIHLHQLLAHSNTEVTILLSGQPIADMPQEDDHWHYQVLSPKSFWTQWALPVHLFTHRHQYDVLFNPGHYAPRYSPIPYVTSVMDTAYLDFPKQFTTKDQTQLSKWTAYSVHQAQKVITISEYSKKSIIQHYHLHPQQIEVIFPAANFLYDSLGARETDLFFSAHHIEEPYILFVGTIQPRKNLLTLLSAFEKYSRRIAAQNLANKNSKRQLKKHAQPTLVLAGKVGWQADDILSRIKSSSFSDHIVMTGFISDEEKRALYEHAMCNVLIGIHEGFGIPPLEAMMFGCIPIVADATSLPEVVGKAGYVVEPNDEEALANTFEKISKLTKRRRGQIINKGYRQAKKFSWDESAQKLLTILKDVANK